MCWNSKFKVITWNLCGIVHDQIDEEKQVTECYG